MAPRIRISAYFLKLLLFDASYLSMASIRPITPELMRSSRSTLLGRRDAILLATTLANGDSLKVALASAAAPEHKGAPGTCLGVVKGKGPIIACGEGALVLEKVKPAGKGWMDGFSLWNGNKVEKGDVLGAPQPSPTTN